MGRVVLRTALGLALLVVMGSCSTSPETPQESGFFSGYDFGNRDDMSEIRRDRPSYRDYD